MLGKITAHWIDSKEDRYFINKDGDNKWIEYQKGKVFCTFDFIRYEDDQSVVVYDPDRKLFVKITEHVIMSSYNVNNIKSVISRGSWKIKPTQDSSNFL